MVGTHEPPLQARADPIHGRTSMTRVWCNLLRQYTNSGHAQEPSEGAIRHPVISANPIPRHPTPLGLPVVPLV